MKTIIRILSIIALITTAASVHAADPPPARDPMQPAPGAPADAGTQTVPSLPPEEEGIRFNETAFQTVVETLARQAKIPIIIPESLPGSVTMHLPGVDAKEALRSILESKNYTLVESNGIFTVQTKAAEIPEVFVHNLDYANTKDVVPAVRAVLTARGKLEVVGSALIISDVPSNVSKIKDLLKQLDDKTAQVLIETRLYEMVRNPKKELGFDWSRVLGGTGIVTKFGGAPAQGQLTPFLWNVGMTGSKSMPASAVLTNSQLEMVVRFLNTDTDTDTELIATPRIVTANNREAVIKIITEEPIPSFQFNARTAAFEISGFTYKEIGNILKVTPSVNKAGFITLDVEPIVSNVAGVRAFGGSGVATGENEGSTTTGGSGLQANIPVISTRTLITRVLLKDGDTLMIGGLVQTDKINTYHKVPVIGDIPILGMFFRDKSLETRKRNLLIFITPNELKGNQKTGFEDQADGLNQGEVYTDDVWMPKDNAKPHHLTPPRQEDLDKKKLIPVIKPRIIEEKE